jgi:diguanylate cyclase (GGDEF)-like protein
MGGLDPLTGIMNRREIMEALQRELARSERQHLPLGAALVDINQFKAVKDDFGHRFGDHALKEVAGRLRAKLRIYGSGRYRREEFLMLFPGCDLINLLVRLDEMRFHINRTAMNALERHRTVSISASVSVFEGLSPLHAEAVFQHADLGLYEERQKCRDRIEYGKPALASSSLPSVAVAASSGSLQ